jgi:hypothetical protein
MNQKFLLIAPWDYQLYKVIEKNLQYLGYDVTVIHNNHYRYTLKDTPIKIKAFFRKIVSKKKKKFTQNHTTSTKKKSNYR